jgi:DNA-binding PadR family transcriptional regulator
MITKPIWNIPEYRKMFKMDLLLFLKVVYNHQQEGITFTKFKESYEFKDGQLSKIAIFLSIHNYITIDKNFVNRYPQSTYHITEKGIKFIESFSKEIKEILLV